MNTGNEITEREMQVLKYIVQYRKTNHGVPPTQREIFAGLNQQLPKRRIKGKTKDALVSWVQVLRVIIKLREKGLMLDPERVENVNLKHRNYIPTPEGERIALGVE